MYYSILAFAIQQMNRLKDIELVNIYENTLNVFMNCNEMILLVYVYTYNSSLVSMNDSFYTIK